MSCNNLFPNDHSRKKLNWISLITGKYSCQNVMSSDNSNPV